MLHTSALLIVSLSIFLSDCGWERKVVFPASSTGTQLEIQQSFPANGWGIRVVLQSRGRAKTLYELRGDVFLDFADVAWSAKDAGVAVFTCGTPPIRLAYSLTNSNSLSFSEMQSMLAAHIREQYHLDVKKTSDKDVFEWACSLDGKRAFLQRYPGGSPR